MLLRSTFVALVLLALPAAASQDEALQPVLDRAAALTPLETVVVAQGARIISERCYRGHKTTAPTSIMSASKSIIAALVGIAIDKGVLQGVDQPIAPLLADQLPDKPDPLLETVTIGNLLSMQAGLRSTSGPRYGGWISSRNWVKTALAQPFDDVPGGRMV